MNDVLSLINNDKNFDFNCKIISSPFNCKGCIHLLNPIHEAHLQPQPIYSADKRE